MESIEEILIGKLTKEELGRLCDDYDSGCFNWDILLEKDRRNYPCKYIGEIEW
jgi:hypothetical protein